MFSILKLSLCADSEVFLLISTVPSKWEVLKILFFYMREVKLNFQKSARLAVQETTALCEKARIPTQAVKNCIPKMNKLYEHWKKS